jgi:demethylmenaquinone methyltransferase / 2-methoxy-6-polyprenyl-1,4-benzoquinol methylase
MAWFRKSAEADPLPVSMTGVKLGDRVLAVGVTDPVLIAALATKAGLTGSAVVIDADEERARKGAAAIERAGALAEVTRAPWTMFPYDSAHFDIAVMRDLLPSLGDDVRRPCVSEVLRVLRPGGRVVIIETVPRGGLGGLLHRHAAPLASSDILALLQDAGFAAARLLTEREGVQYIEAVRSSALGAR